jgi:hypothetical protein
MKTGRWGAVLPLILMLVLIISNYYGTVSTVNRARLGF